MYGKNKTNYLINKNELPTAFILKEVRISFCFVVADWLFASVNFTHVPNVVANFSSGGYTLCYLSCNQLLFKYF